MDVFGCSLIRYFALVVLLVQSVRCGYHYKEPWSQGHQQDPGHYHDLPPHHVRILPRELMVDVINNLALTLLEVHNQHNDNNIAISPYGATSVLVALAEGLLGDGAREVIQAGNIPGDLAAVRVGLRDIHRHLKSYFIPKEGFLAGLTLSSENVTLNPEYEHILRFYGYDIKSFNTVFYPESTSRTPLETTTAQVNQGTTVQASTPQEDTIMTSTEKAPVQITSTNGVTDRGTTSINDESTETIAAIKAERTTRKNSKSTKTDSNAIESRDDGDEMMKQTTPNGLKVTKRRKSSGSTKRLKATTVAYESTESTEDITVAETRYPTSVVYSTLQVTDKMTTESVSVKSTTAEEDDAETTEGLGITAATTINPKLKLLDVAPRTTRPKINSVSTNPSITIEEITTTFEPTPTKPIYTTDLMEITTEMLDTSAATIPEQISTNLLEMTTPIYADVATAADFYTTPSIIPIDQTSTITVPPDGNILYSDYNVAPTYEGTLDYNSLSDPSTFNPATTPDYGYSTDLGLLSTINPVFPNTADFNITAGIVDPSNVTIVRRSTRSVVDYIIAKYYDNYDFGQRRQYHIPPPQPSEYHPEPPLTFLVNGRVPESNINFMTYDTILPFYFVNGLNALALSFPLDSSKYYLLLVLPVDPDGIDRLICNFKQVTTLKGIIENLKYTHVKAIIPSFNLKGYVILTPTFQKIGIRKIFEPRQADFSQMTAEKDIYVTNIEQAITVTIRNYVDPANLPYNGKFRNYRPVDFVADHPFLYFVMDSEIHVSLMAGKILNPLNSRIR